MTLIYACNTDLKMGKLYKYMNLVFNLHFTGCDITTDCRIHIPIGAREDTIAVTKLSTEATGESTRGWRCTYQETQNRHSR